MTYILPAIGAVAFFAIATVILYFSFYRKTTKEQSFVRTGMGGEKVVMNGGSIVIPGVHERIPVNMKTLRLSVSRNSQEALITKDPLRVDVAAEFYVRVKQDAKSISTAAQTLGERSMDPASVKELIEGKFVDALRGVAATMTLKELHEQRSDFVQKVQESLLTDLDKNGLELESVSLTSLDQTSKANLDPNNSFDAQGLRIISEVTANNERERNEIEQAARIAIEERNLEAEKRSLQIKRDEENERIATQREIDTKKAENESQLAQIRAEREKEAQLAKVEAEKEARLADIDAERQTRERNVEANRMIELAEIETRRETEEKQAASARAIAIANQEKEIAIAEKSRQKSEADAAANKARALAVSSEEAVKTEEALATAKREKEVAVLAAEKDAEQQAAEVRIMADADYEASEKQAMAKERLAEALLKELEAEARGKELINEAANVLSDEMINLDLKKALISGLPAIVEQVTKPVEAIDSLRILSMPGVQNIGMTNGVVQSAPAGGTPQGLPQQIVEAALAHRAQIPLIDKLMEQVGLDLDKGLGGITDQLKEIIDTDPVLEQQATNSPDTEDDDAISEEASSDIVNQDIPDTEKSIDSE